jgi:hypothetical protein
MKARLLSLVLFLSLAVGSTALSAETPYSVYLPLVVSYNPELLTLFNVN